MKEQQSTQTWPTGSLPLRRSTKQRIIASHHFHAHKRPVLDRAVCGFAAIDIAAVLWLAPKHFAAIQLPRTKHPFPKPRAASGWLPAAAFHPANPQTEASAKFLVPFSKKGTSFRDGNACPRNPRYNSARYSYAFRALAPRAIQRSLHAPAFLRLMQPALYSAHHGIRLHSLREALTRYDSRLPAPCTPHHTASAVAYAFPPPPPANRPLSMPKPPNPAGFPALSLRDL